MFRKRPDGRVVKSVEPLQMIMPYIMKTRTDSMNMYEDTFACEIMDKYIKEKEAEGIKLGYMHIFIAAIVRIIALRPQLNRFIMRGKIYTRPKIWVSFVVHPTLADGSVGTTIKLCFEGTETILEIAEIINKAIEKETTKRTGENGTDKLARVLTHIPGPLISFAVNTLMWMDKHNILPKAIIELSPFHTSFFITNLKSLGINHVFHHTYEFGTQDFSLASARKRKFLSFRIRKLFRKSTWGLDWFQMNVFATVCTSPCPCVNCARSCVTPHVWKLHLRKRLKTCHKRKLRRTFGFIYPK